MKTVWLWRNIAKALILIVVLWIGGGIVVSLIFPDNPIVGAVYGALAVNVGVIISFVKWEFYKWKL